MEIIVRVQEGGPFASRRYRYRSGIGCAGRRNSEARRSSGAPQGTHTVIPHGVTTALGEVLVPRLAAVPVCIEQSIHQSPSGVGGSRRHRLAFPSTSPARGRPGFQVVLNHPRARHSSYPSTVTSSPILEGNVHSRDVFFERGDEIPAVRADASLRLVWFDVRLLGEVVDHAVRDAKLGEQAFLTRGAWRQYLLRVPRPRGGLRAFPSSAGAPRTSADMRRPGEEDRSLSASARPCRRHQLGWTLLRTEPRGGRRCRRCRGAIAEGARGSSRAAECVRPPLRVFGAGPRARETRPGRRSARSFRGNPRRYFWAAPSSVLVDTAPCAR